MLASPYKIVEKPHWPGREKWIVNTEKYCGKVLQFDEDEAECSWHYHEIKDEVMYCNEGKFMIHYSWDDSYKNASFIELKKGDSFHIPVGLRHSIQAMQNDSELFEFSTQHFDEDSYRIEKDK